MDFKEKYLKYKTKYLNLKKQMGGALDIKNALVMGGGPVGLITTLSLLTRYPHNNKGTKTSCLDCNTIFLFEKSHPWRPQIFFFQNSFRDYSSIDFLRDIDLETYKRIEKIGCYIGSPPSTKVPYCISSTKLDTVGNLTYKETALTRDSTTIRAPSSIKIGEPNPVPDNNLYLMHHISFHVSDLETILLDRIITLNKANINYYNRHTGSVYDEIKIKVDMFQTKFNNLICNYDLVKALLIKDKMISDGSITETDFKPLVILIHPYNKFCNMNSYILYKLIKDDIKLYVHLINDNFISNDSFDENWEIKKEVDMSINFKLSDNPNKNTYKILNNDEYDLVFECESINKQFGDKSDYWFLKNRDVIDKNTCVKLENNMLLGIILNKNSIIKLTNPDQNLDEIYIVEKRELDFTMKGTLTKPNVTDRVEYKDFLSTKIDKLIFKFYLKKLIYNNNGNNIDLNNYVLMNDNFTFSIEYDIQPIQSDINKLNGTYNGEIIFLYSYITSTEYNYANDPHLIMESLSHRIHRHLITQTLTNIDIVHDTTKNIKTYTEIFKINSLMIEEINIDLSTDTVKKNAENAIVNACVLLYNASGINKMYDDEFYKTFKMGRDIDRVPLASGPLADGDNYEFEYNKTQKLRKYVDKKSMINQIYINNDQVQYFNNNTPRIHRKNILHYKIGGPNPQHAFRVFGVNINNNKLLNMRDVELEYYLTNHTDLKKYLQLSSTTPYFYNGLQISSEINNLYRKLKKKYTSKPKSNKYLSDLIFINLYIMGYLYTTNDDYTIDIVNKINMNIIPKWNNTYKNIVSDKKISTRANNPINNNMLNIFSISLKYKEKPIEEESGKKIFNMGDSNATVNFFSGTGLNTGVANIRMIMEEYDFNDTNINILNNKIKNKSRRTIYNSLLSSQNPSYLSPKRKFNLLDGTQLGFYEKNISQNKNLDEIKEIIFDTINNSDLYKTKGTKTGTPTQYITQILNTIISDREMSKDQAGSVRNIAGYLKYFEDIFTEILNTTNPNSPLSNPDDSDASDNIREDIENIKKALYYNTYVFLHNIHVGNPLITDNNYTNECITYANHLHFNHFDVCNFLTGNNINNNEPYYCDMIKDNNIDKSPYTYEPRRTTQINNSFNYTT